MAFEQGAGFRICGAVVRRFVAQSGKAAFVTIDVPGERGSKKIELRSFDRSIVADIGSLGAGQIVECTGTVDVEKLTNKQRDEVKVDGYAKWMPALTIRVLRIEGSSRAPSPASQTGDDANASAALPPTSPATNWDESDVPF